MCLFLTIVACCIRATELETSPIIIFFNDEFILLCLRDRTSNTYPQPNLVDVFFTQEILDFNQRSILLNNNFDGDMSLQRSHLVMKAQHNTLSHVLNMTADGSDSGQFLSVISPFVNLMPLLFLSRETQLYIAVIEVPLKGSSEALHNDCDPLQSDGDIFWNVNSLITENGLHSQSRCGKESTMNNFLNFFEGGYNILIFLWFSLNYHICGSHFAQPLVFVLSDR